MNHVRETIEKVVRTLVQHQICILNFVLSKTKMFANVVGLLAFISVCAPCISLEN